MTKALIAIGLIAASFATYGDTCPTQLIQTHDGHWVSPNAPGWRTSTALPHQIKLNTRDFGGALYAPKQHRLACVYRSSNGLWVPLVSNQHHGIQINRHIKDKHQKKAAWKWNSLTKDFTCGRPTVTSPESCQFTVNS